MLGFRPRLYIGQLPRPVSEHVKAWPPVYGATWRDCAGEWGRKERGEADKVGSGWGIRFSAFQSQLLFFPQNPYFPWELFNKIFYGC